MPNIGYDEIGGGSGATADNWQNESTVGSDYRYVASAGDTVTKARVYGDDTGDCEIGVYVYSGGRPTTKVGSVTVTIGAGAQWHEATMSLALTAGVEYCVAIDYYISGSWNMRYDSPGGTQTSAGTGVNALPGTWSELGTSGDIASYYVEVTPGSSGPNEGSVSGAISWVGSVAGTAPVPGAKQGAATGAISWAGVVTGKATRRGAATGAISWVGRATSPFSIKVPSTISGRRLLDQNGDPYFMKVFSSWKLANRLSDADITTALEGVAGNKFNGVVVWNGGTLSGDSDQYENEAGDPFWNGTPWRMNQGTTLGAAWSSVDHAIAECARLGMVYHFSFCSSNGASGCAPDWETATDADMYAVGVALASRYTGFDNIVWHVMFDDPTFTTVPRALRIRALFDGINDTEGTSRRPIRWCEVNQGSTTDEQGWFGTSLETRFVINAGYEYVNNSVETVETWYSDSSTLGAGGTPVPAMDSEPPYDGAPHYSGVQAQQLRERSLALAIEGLVGINYGQEDWWPFGSAGIYTEGLTWDQVQSHVHTVQQSYIWDLVSEYVEDITWTPASVIDNGSTGVGSGDTKAAEGKSNTAALVLFPSSRTATVDTRLATPTSVKLSWWDPTSGVKTQIAIEPQQTGRSVTLPAAHADTSRDYVLIIEALPLSDGAATGAISWAGVANGTRVSKGAATRTISWVGVVTGEKIAKGAAVGAISWSGVVAGEKPSVAPKAGAANGTIGWVGVVAGKRVASGASNGAISWVGVATGKRQPKAAAIGTISWVGTVIGGRLGKAIGSIGWAGVVNGQRSPKAAATGAISWVGSAIGFAPTAGVNDGSAIGAINWVGLVAGSRQPKASATGAISWSGIVLGGRIGYVIGSITWNGNVAGAAPGLDVHDGAATGAIGWSGSVVGVSTHIGAAIGAILWVGLVTSLFAIDPETFLLSPHVVGYAPGVVVSYKPSRRGGT